ncbi:WD40 repeat-like protein [Calocera cornea HHB12733]|uniref:WD40 repeat-like protein n=1 Tax=Calocera cornea HHB12733 TaxID=1353952 RepID=A0A165E0I4_9BASI|nr:WD40 repeat-like protein [Calocera cornea HHB12733]
MLQSALLPTSLFQDVITDLSYSYYGTSLAVASADHRVRIFSLAPSHPHHANGTSSADHSNHPHSRDRDGNVGSSGGWELDDEFKAHDAPLTRICFAHPAYGPLLATAAFDRTVKIWEDVPSRAANSQRTRWVERKVLPDLGASQRSLEFAPEALGLKLAGVGADGWVRIWECLDLPSLTSWEVKEELDMHSLLGAPGSGGTDVGWSVAWCAERWWGDVLAVCCGQAGCVKVRSPSHSPLPPAPEVVPLTSVAWAPACGRSFHLLAAGSEAGGVYLWRVTPRSQSYPGTAPPEEENAWQAGVELVGDFPSDAAEGGRPVGRVQFNPTGTILSSAGDDGRVRLWKASFTGVWRAMGSVFATPGGEEEDGEAMEEDDGGEGYES